MDANLGIQLDAQHQGQDNASDRPDIILLVHPIVEQQLRTHIIGQVFLVFPLRIGLIHDQIKSKAPIRPPKYLLQAQHIKHIAISMQFLQPEQQLRDILFQQAFRAGSKLFDKFVQGIRLVILSDDVVEELYFYAAVDLYHAAVRALRYFGCFVLDESDLPALSYPENDELRFLCLLFLVDFEDYLAFVYEFEVLVEISHRWSFTRKFEHRPLFGGALSWKFSLEDI